MDKPAPKTAKVPTHLTELALDMEVLMPNFDNKTVLIHLAVVVLVAGQLGLSEVRKMISLFCDTLWYLHFF